MVFPRIRNLFHDSGKSAGKRENRQEIGAKIWETFRPWTIWECDLILLRVALVFKYQLLFNTVLHHDALS